MIFALWAFLAMLVQNVIATLMSQAENRHRPIIAGITEMLQYRAGIVCTILAVGGAVQSEGAHHTTLTVMFHAPVLFTLLGADVGNFLGSYAGTKLGDKLIRPGPVMEAAAKP